MSEILTMDGASVFTRSVETATKWDGSDPPPPGTRCAWCKGHFCPAKGYVGEAAVCRECGEGKPCARTLAVKKATTPIDGSDLAPAAPKSYERRCADCKGLLSSLTAGTMCWPCKKRAQEIDKRAAAKAARSADLALGKCVSL